MAYLNPALSQFRREVDAEYPNRDKQSDGTIADDKHASWSQHQPDPPPKEEIDAWDMDVEVNGRGKPYRDDVEHLKRCFERHPSALLWINDRKIATRGNNWRPVDYDGDNPHDKHVHWETRESHDEVTTPFGVAMLTDEDLNRIHNLYLGKSGPTLAVAAQETYRALPTIAEIKHELGQVRTVLESLAAAVSAVPPGGLNADQVRAVVREELDKTRLGS